MEILDNIYQSRSMNDHDESSYLPKNDFLFKKQANTPCYGVVISFLQRKTLTIPEQ